MRRALLTAVAAVAAAVLSAQSPAPTPGAVAPGFSTNLTLFAGTGSGLWRSTDWGGRWAKVTGATSGDKVEEVGAVHAIFTLAPLVYVAGERGIYVSRDFGGAWTRLAQDRAATHLMTTRWPHADPTLLVGTPQGLLVSADGGYRFQETALKDPVYRLEWPGPELVVATGRGVAVSRDTGATFAPRGDGLPEGEVRAIAVSSYFAIDPVIFAGVGERGVWRSGDAGGRWEAAGLDGHRVHDLVWIGRRLFASTSGGVRTTDDAGRTWSPPAAGLEGRAPGRLMFPLAPDSTADAFLGTDDGVFRSADGGLTWRPGGLSGERVLTVATFPPPVNQEKKKKKR